MTSRPNAKIHHAKVHPREAELAPPLDLIAEKLCILHPRRQDGTVAGAPGEDVAGGDVDCAVRGLDPLWPLRLPAPWRLCQCLHHDVATRCWVLEERGNVIAIDALEDPLGIGEYAFSTRLPYGPGTGLALPAVRAAYLTIKRIRKRIADPGQWAKISSLARQDTNHFTRRVQAALGRGVGQSVTDAVLAGIMPSPGLCGRARACLWLLRLRTPVRLVRVPAIELTRLAKRVLQPPGLHVVIAGPDGAGKSRLAETLPGACEGLFRRHLRVHWRPGIFPRPGAALGRKPADPSAPHAQAPHSTPLSALLLVYYWLDFLLGAWLKVVPARARTGLVIQERGWWDIAVDPQRYRLRSLGWLVNALGSLLPCPNLLLVLEADSVALSTRKSELPPRELTRQSRAWRSIAPAGVRKVVLDASRPAPGVASQAREVIAELLEARAVARLGAGWARLPLGASSRWSIPRGPRASAVSSFDVYQPVTPRGLFGWRLARVAASAGAWRLLPRGEAPPRVLRELLAPHLPSRSTFAVARANHAGRYVALIVGLDGKRHGVAKIATDAAGREALAREAAAISKYGPSLPSPLSPPKIMRQAEGVLLLKTVPWIPRLRPWRLPEEVAFAMGAFWRQDGGQQVSHGDFAPWNLLRTRHGWTLIDWEECSHGGIPFFDLFHYLVQGHALLGKPSLRLLRRGLAGEAWVGRAIQAYAAGAGLSPAEAPDYLAQYLHQSAGRIDPSTPDGRSSANARGRLLDHFGSAGTGGGS